MRFQELPKIVNLMSRLLFGLISDKTLEIMILTVLWGFTDYTSSTNANIQLFTVENNIYAKNNGADEVVLRDYELGKVYKIKMFINPKAEEYDIYINDECRALGMKFGFNSIGRLLCFDAKKGETRWSLDNLCIYTDERKLF